MRWRDHDQARAWCAPNSFRDDQSLVVDRDRNDVCAGRRERPSRLDEAWLLDPDLVAGIEDHPAAEIQCTRRAGGDDDLVRRTNETAHRAEEVRDLAPQSRMAFGRKIEALLLSWILPGLAQQARPILEGKGRDVRRARTELRRPVGLVVEGEQRSPALRHVGGPGRRRGGRWFGMRRRHRRHHDAAARRRFQIALGVEQIPCRQHHGPRATQFARDLARTEKLRSRGKGAAQNAVPDMLRDLQVQRHRGGPVDMDPGKGYTLARMTAVVHVSPAGQRRSCPPSFRGAPRNDDATFRYALAWVTNFVLR
ncbi:hypothetical protein ACVIVD_000154 [Bradyrhizobium liaoningense]